MVEESLRNKVRLLTELLKHTQSEQVDLLLQVNKVLENKTIHEKNWSNLTARKMILSSIGTHYPGVDIIKSMELWRQDHKEENDRARKERAKTPDKQTQVYISHYS